MNGRRAFQQQLGDARRDVLRLAAHVGDAIPRCTEALLGGDRELAERVLGTSAAIESLAERIEDDCFHRIAAQQPAADDLRRLLTVMRLTSELDRTAALAANVAKAVFRLEGQPRDARVRGLVQRMSDEAVRLHLTAVDAFAREEADAADRLHRLDDGLDALHRHYVSRVVDACRDGRFEVHVAVQLALVGRVYERMGDHAVNIAERVVFMVTGQRAQEPELEEIG